MTYIFVQEAEMRKPSQPRQQLLDELNSNIYRALYQSACNRLNWAKITGEIK
jgi:hypothetical protein